MTFRELLTLAMGDFIQYGFDGSDRLSEWMRRLRSLAAKDSPSPEALREHMRGMMEMYFRRATSITMTRKKHPGVPLFTITQIKPQLRSELTRRIQASADLIKLNREQAIEKTLQRFAGWASSVPAGGSRVTDKRDTKSDITKALRQMSFEERRVAIDQGHKLMSSIDAVIAQKTGAIAAVWRSHWRQPGYDYRPDHKERDGKVYALRGSWAMQKGLLNKGAGYLDEMTQAAEEPFCRCFVVYLQNLRDLPDGMLTAKGRAELERVKIRAQ